MNKECQKGAMRDWESFQSPDWTLERAENGKRGEYVKVYTPEYLERGRR